LDPQDQNEETSVNHVLELTVNGQPVRQEVPAQLLLVDLLRERLRLTGTHVGCDTSQCGACTVLVDGQSVKSCTFLAVQAQGRSVTTVEGLARKGQPHPIQQAFMACHGLQCGFCTPGMMMTTACLLSRDPRPSAQAIGLALEGNICRCTGYANIVAAVQQAADVMAQEGAQ
jgi:aerobic carbon-monoxide dehydrogenase small subunit